jgi:hypothetical protein
MDNGRNMRKGQHEEAMEKAKDMLAQGFGMGKIVEETNLEEKDVLKAKAKMENRA